MTNPTQLLVWGHTTLRDAMERLEATGCTVLLLVDEAGRLMRTVTDGDLRRLLMRGTTLDGSLALLDAKEPIVTSVPEAAVALEAMNAHGIDQIPVVDATKRPVGVWLRREVDSQILLSSPHMGEEERTFVESAFRTNWIAPLGPNVEAFERELARTAGVGHAAAVVSGTAAIHLALRLVGVERGDTVFCSTLTFVATANPILYEGGVPVFIDSEPATWNMSPAALERALDRAAQARRLPRAVVVVNLYGQSADMDPLLALCDRYGIPLIEDAAESLGASYKGRASGSFGRLGTFSFNGNKIITTSGGGMLVSDDKALIDQARFLSTQARDPVPSPYYHHTQVGYNYRLSNVLAGIGLGQLKVLGDRVDRRRAVFERYRAALGEAAGLSWMPESPFGRSTRWLTAALLDPERTALTPASLIRQLATERIEARHVWKPLHLQPLFSRCEYFPHHEGKNIADDLFSRGICLPSGSNISEAQQDRVIRVLRSALRTVPA